MRVVKPKPVFVNGRWSKINRTIDFSRKRLTPVVPVYTRLMTEAKKATIVTFQKEQGFGRVNVEGEGELPFDAVVAQPPAEKLLAGTEVMVETGPSRIPGKTKVVKLWIGDTPP